MTDSGLWRVLSGDSTALVMGITWASDELRASSSGAGELEGLATFAARCGAQFMFVDAASSDAPQSVAALRAGGVEPVWAVAGPLGRAAENCGWTEVIRASANRLASLTGEIDRATNAALADIELGIESGARVHVVADDLASDSGWLVDPKAVQTLLPCYRRLVHAVTRGGGRALFHSDGDITAACPSLADVGFTAVHVGATAHGSLGFALRAVHDCGLVPVGGIPARPSGASTEDLVAECLGIARQGPFALCDDGGLTEGAQLARVLEVQQMVHIEMDQHREKR